MIPICKHCRKSKVNRPRGLCWGCYYTPGVKDHAPLDFQICPAWGRELRRSSRDAGTDNCRAGDAREDGSPRGARPTQTSSLAPT